MKFVVLAISPDAFVDFGQVCHHSFDEGLREFTNARRGRAKFPKVIEPLRRLAVLKIAPKMILNRGLPRLAPLSHGYLVRKSAMTLVIPIAVRAASVPRLSVSPRQR